MLISAIRMIKFSLELWLHHCDCLLKGTEAILLATWLQWDDSKAVSTLIKSF